MFTDARHTPELLRVQDVKPVDTYAWHGTSFIAIEHLAEHGSMPTSGSWGDEFYIASEHLCPGDQKRAATMYAAWNAEKALVLQALGFTPTDMQNFMHLTTGGMSRFEGPEWDVFEAVDLKPRGIPKKNVIEMFPDYAELGFCKKYGGVLLALAEPAIDETINVPEGALPATKRTILQEGALLSTDNMPLLTPAGIPKYARLLESDHTEPVDEEIIQIPDGFPLELIRGVTPLGISERMQFNSALVALYPFEEEQDLE